jgi:molecular chaperone GrpE (heat shock protein)
MSDTATAAADTPVSTTVPTTDATSSPHPAPQDTPANDGTPGTPESNAQEGSGAGEPAAAKPNEGKQGEQERRKESVQERIDKAVFKQREAERREAAALARAAELEKKLQQPPANAPLEEIDRYERRKDLVDWRVDELRSEAADARNNAVEAAYEKFAARAEAVADRIPDLIERFSDPNLPVSQIMGEFVADSDRGAEIAHFLADNPREAARIKSLSDAQQGVALARLEARFVAPPVRKVSTAPTPPPSVTGNSASSSRTADEFSVAEMQSHLKKKGVLR